MSVCFYPCANCSRTFCECGRYVNCGDNCECGRYVNCGDNCDRRWCSEECAKVDGYEKDCDSEGSCKFCRNVEANDSELLDFLLKRYILTREEVLKDYLDGNISD